MSVKRWMWMSLVVIGWYAGTPSAAIGAGFTFAEDDAVNRVNITADPPIGDWQVDGHVAAGGPVESTGGYRLALDRQDRDGHACWTIRLNRADGGEFRIVEYACEACVPLGHVAAVFDTQVPEGPSIFRQAPQVDAAIEVRPNRGIPFMMACDHYGHNSLAFGPIDQTGTYRITGRRDGRDYAIEAARTEYAGDGWFRGREFKDSFFISTHDAFWFDAAGAYADAVDERTGYVPLPIPETAWRPYYSTWYAFGDKIDHEIVWDNAVLAAEMGIGNFLVFIGWGECENWFSSDNAWGDYTPCSPRFPDLAGLVSRMQKELGLAVYLWTAPTWIGTGSKSFARMQDHRSKWPEGGYDRNLDARSPAAREHIRERFAFMARELGADGFYVDFLDTLYNRNDAAHEKDPALFGTALDEFLAACYGGFAAERPALLAEYRVPFANLLTKRHASVFTTTYTDHRWDRNRLLAVAHRPFSRGVVTTCDPLVWTPQEFEDRDFVGKTLSAVMMCGPPGISMDLMKMDANRRRELKAWFDFYARHRESLSLGRFRPFGDEYHYPEMMVTRHGTAYVWVSRWETGHIALPEGTRHSFIFTNLPRDESFIARLDITAISGLEPGRYLARRYNSTLESHDAPMEITVAPPPPPAGRPPLKTARENWDWPPSETRPSLDIARGGLWELKKME